MEIRPSLRIQLGLRPLPSRQAARERGREGCPGQDSNLHGRRPSDFKSPASTRFATRAVGTKLSLYCPDSKGEPEAQASG